MLMSGLLSVKCVTQLLQYAWHVRQNMIPLSFILDLNVIVAELQTKNIGTTKFDPSIINLTMWNSEGTPKLSTGRSDY